MDLIVITGPTASGKTAVGALLAQALSGEIVSADSMQVYQYMDIGTAKPTVGEMLGIPHHLISFVAPQKDYSVARYVEDASECIDGILARNKVPIIVGGTGLYIESLLSGRGFSLRGDEDLRRSLEVEYDIVGGKAMLERLRQFDPLSADRLHFNDKRRVVRAIEIFEITGKTISQHDLETKALPPRYNARKFALTATVRSDLYARVNARVDKMISDGLEYEVRFLLDMGVSALATSMQAIGYKEMVGFIRGEFDMIQALDKIKMESRRYAKRQLSWFRRYEDIKWITWESAPDVSRMVEVIIREAQ
ncbi:MAG: tRNA (adenosine(37)-N6)-dimethylallyltransferase MiaA [Oscillospiraceae bacterium]|nr:tRNA (adenosine(37)-N6)-dimethylallyltransferase MiaA [Oscillospiraceae bacterium]